MIEALRVEALYCSFGRGPAAVNSVDLKVEPGQFFCLLGPSGCGKTTLLRLIGGYLKPQAGDIFIKDHQVTHLPPERRHVGMVFQNYALFPHLTAWENVAFGLEVRRVPTPRRDECVDAMLDRVGLTAAERKRFPAQLSGGQQQRVALARALVIEPDLLLLDEPLANLDRRLRERLRAELRQLQRKTGITTLLVTHDQEEAFALADQVGVMVQGQFLQVGSPSGLYHQPATPAVARFVGEANLLQVDRIDATALHLQGGLTLSHPFPERKPGDWLMIRPESCCAGSAALHCQHHWRGRVIQVTFLGCDQLIEVEVAPDQVLKIRKRPEDREAIQTGDTLPVGFEGDHLWPIPQPDPEWASSLLAVAGVGS